ncbi:DUF6152 family protein [Xanthobacter sp. KR7-65]|uniref:DUF6152 family protein n=1 Tax=Xanthobacter sp. KR7-65 TaxID=3156612 RepID=UPI0032B5DBBE
MTPTGHRRLRDTSARTLPARRIGAAILAATVLTGGAALAHHGWGSYDTAKAFTMTGPVAHLEWANPHAHLMMQHEGATWEATLAPLSRMEARGLSADRLKAGTTVSVYGYPSTRTPNEMRAERITVDGKTVELR